MLKFHSDKKQVFECKIKIEGAKLKETNVRLVLQDGNVNRIYEGKLDVLGNCAVHLPPLDNFSNSQGKATLEVRVNDIVFEPYRSDFNITKTQVVVNEVLVKDAEVKEVKPKVKTKSTIKPKVKEEKSTRKKNISMTDKKMVKEMLVRFNKIPKKYKKALKEHIEFDYKPSVKVRNWAKERFNDLNALHIKVVMYQVENILK